MTALATIAGADVLRAVVDMPSRGPWSAEVRLASATVPAGAQTLAFEGGLSMPCTVRTAAVDSRGSVVAFLVGGADGLGAAVEQHYRNGFSRDALGKIARASGETLASDIATDIGAVQFGQYTLAGDCTTALDSLARAVGVSLGQAVTWRIRGDGALWMGAESWPAYTLPKSDAVLDSLPGIGSYLVGVATPTITPGLSVSGVGRVVTARHVVTADDARSWLSVEMPSLGGQFYRSARAALGLRDSDARQLWRYGTFRARVIAQAADLSTVDVQFDAATGLPPMNAIPVKYAAGIKVQFGSGDSVEIAWDRGDPERIFARPVSDGIAPVVIHIGSSSGSKLVVLDGDTVNKNATLGTWITNVEAALLAAGSAITTPFVGNAIGTAASSATLTKAK